MVNLIWYISKFHCDRWQGLPINSTKMIPNDIPTKKEKQSENVSNKHTLIHICLDSFVF